MSQTSIDGKRFNGDIRRERLAAGTIGGEHVVQGTLRGQQISGIIDDQDSRITYGRTDGSAISSSYLYVESGSPFSSGGTYTVLAGLFGGAAGAGGEGTYAELTFTGTAIGVLGGRNPNSGKLQVYIDGVLKAGRLPISAVLDVAYGEVPVKAGDTTITFITNLASFPSSGSILLGNEVITYSGKTTYTLTGCTITSNHEVSETAYLWDSSLDLQSDDHESKRLLYYNQFLEPGQHTIRIVTATGGTGLSRVYFDGFITGSIIGARSIFTQLGTVTFTVTTDANGGADLGYLTSSTNERQITGLLGHTVATSEVSSAVKLGHIGVMYDANDLIQLYYRDGPSSATIDITVTYCYLGESL